MAMSFTVNKQPILLLQVMLFILCLCPRIYSQSIQAKHDKYRPLITGAKEDTALVKKMLSYSNALMDYNNDTALPVIRQTLLLSEKIKDTLGMGESTVLLGIVYLENGTYDSAKIYLDKGVKHFKSIGNFKKLGRAYNNLGNLHYFQDMLDEAISYYMESIRCKEKAGVPRETTISYTGIANCFSKLDQLEKNMFYLNKAAEMAIAEKDTISLITTLINKSINFGRTGKNDECISTYKKAIELSDKKNYLQGRYLARLNLGDRYITLLRFDSALYYLRAAEPLALQFDKPYYQAVIYIAFARVYDATQEYAKARTHTLKAIEISTTIKDLIKLKQAYGLLTRINGAMGMREETVNAFDLYEKYNDSLKYEQSMNRVNQLETKYRTQQKDKEISEKQLAITQKDLELQKKNTYILLTLAALAVLLTAGIFFWFSYRQKQRLQQQRLITLEKERELAAVQAMMEGEEKERVRIASNLHDGAGSILAAVKLYVGSLGNQYGQLSTSTAYRETLSLLNDAAVEIRETTHNLMPRIIQQDGLEAAVRAYCEKLNKNRQLKIEFQSYGLSRRFDESLELMVYRTVQELLGNVLKHAEASSVLVQLSFGAELFTITVEDNGKGFGLQEKDQSSGIGIYGLQSRVEAFSGKLNIDSSPQGTAVYIEFNMEALAV